MEWTSPRPQHQFEQFQAWNHHEVEEEEIQEEKAAIDRYVLPPRSTSPLKMEASSSFGHENDGGMMLQPLNSLSIPQLEDTTEIQPFCSIQSEAFSDNGVFSSNLPPLPSPGPQFQQQQRPDHQQQFDEQQSSQFSSQYLEFSTGLTSYYPPPAALPSTPMPRTASRPPVNYFPEGIPILRNLHSSAPTLSSSFVSLEQQPQHLPPVLEDQGGNFDNAVAHDVGPTGFSSLASTTTRTSLQTSLTLPMGNFPARPSPSTCSTSPDYAPSTAPLGRAKRGGELSEPFAQMATSHEPKFSPDKRKLCCVEGCKSQARAFNRCKRHGGSKRCSSPGCTKSVQSRGLCIRHGGGSRCQEPGCTRASQSHGKCKMHGGGRPCVVAGCEKKAHLKQLCRKHGGGAKCCVAGCEKWAQRQGMCMTHFKGVGAELNNDRSIDRTLKFGSTASPPPTFPSSSPPTSLRNLSEEL